MKRILLADDDSQMLRLYRDGLSEHGLQVDAAADGQEAVQFLRACRPDVVVLDLLMPKLAGLEVLRFIRSQAGLDTVPVVVFFNSYLNELAEQAAKLGVEKALLKVDCSSPVLLRIINDILAGQNSRVELSEMLAIPVPAATAPPGKTGAEDRHAQARRGFLSAAPQTHAAIRDLCQRFSQARNDLEREARLQNFYRRVHAVTAAAGLAQCHHVALLAGAFEALLFEVVGKPALITPSLLRTVAFTVDLLGTLIERAHESAPDIPISTQVLVVDDDPLSNRLVTAMLRRTQLQPRSTEDPLAALQWLREHRYDLILLDIEMPRLDGFELCRQLRLLPGYRKTPIIYVTSHSDFHSRARSVLSGGNDLIAKPVLPMELAVKALAHLLKSQLTEPAPAR